MPRSLSSRCSIIGKLYYQVQVIKKKMNGTKIAVIRLNEDIGNKSEAIEEKWDLAKGKPRNGTKCL